MNTKLAWPIVLIPLIILTATLGVSSEKYLEDEMRGVTHIAVLPAVVYIDDEFESSLRLELQSQAHEWFQFWKSKYTTVKYTEEVPWTVPEWSVTFQLVRSEDGDYFGYRTYDLKRVVRLYPSIEGDRPFRTTVFVLTTPLFISKDSDLHETLKKETREAVSSFMQIVEFELPDQ